MGQWWTLFQFEHVFSSLQAALGEQHQRREHCKSWDLLSRTKDDDSILTRPVAGKSNVGTMELTGKLSLCCSKSQLKASYFPTIFAFFFNMLLRN